MIQTKLRDPQDVDFGDVAAERDLAHGLLSYFMESKSYDSIVNGSKFIALGNRGAGKTAILKKLKDAAKTDKSNVIELSPDDFSYELLSSALKAEQEGNWAKQNAFAAAWKFLIYVLVMKKLVEKGGYKGGNEKRIYDYVRDNHGNVDKNPIAVMVSYLKRFEGIKLGNYEASLKATELMKLYRLEEIDRLLPCLDDVLSRQNSFFVLVDELDRGWDGSEDAKAFVAGLFNASVALNDRHQSLRVIVSLRRELYNNIPSLYEDAQKVRGVIEQVEWDEERLYRLIAERIRHSLKTPFMEDETAWSVFMEPTLNYRKTKSFNYLIDRTLYRPRELIQFCNDLKDAAIKSSTKMPLDYSTVVEAEISYSRSRCQDIASEFRFQYPGLLSIFETFRGHVYNYDRDRLEEHCLRIAYTDVKVSPEAQAWTVDLEPDPFIDVLWQVGFLRALAVGGIKGQQRSGSRFLGPHQIDSLNLETVRSFHVHPMFRSYLGLKEK